MTNKEMLHQSMDSSVQKNTTPVQLTLAGQIKKAYETGGGFEAIRDMMGEQNAKRFVQNVVSIVTNPESILKTCSPSSIIHSSMVAAYTDLSIDANLLGQSALIPFKGNATFQVMRNGLVVLARRTRTVELMRCEPVYEGNIEYMNRFTGEITIVNQDRKGILEGYLAYIRLMDGSIAWEYMTMEEILQHGQRYSRSFNSPKGLWQDPQGKYAMYSKTVLKRCIKRWVPMQQTIPEQFKLATAIKYDQGTPKSLDIETGEVYYPDGRTITDIEAEEIQNTIREAEKTAGL